MHDERPSRIAAFSSTSRAQGPKYPLLKRGGATMRGGDRQNVVENA